MSPQRIASLAPSATEALLQLGAAQPVIAVTEWCPQDAQLSGAQRLKGWSNLKAAEVLALKPDLVITSSLCQAELMEALKREGLPLLHQDPRSLADIAADLRALGTALGRSGQGDALARRFEDGVAALRAAVPADAPRPRVYLQEWHRPPMVAGNWVPELITAAGGTPFLLTPGSISTEISWEELMEFDPQMVVYNICGQGLRFDPHELYSVEGWDRTEAARMRRVFSVDDDLFNRPGLGLLQGAALLQALLAECFGAGARVESLALRRLSDQKGFKH